MRVLLPIYICYAFIFLFLGAAKFKAQGFYDPNIDLRVYKVALEPNGKILVAGDFSNVGGQPRSRVARLNPDGTLDTSFLDPRVDGSDPSTNHVFTVARQPDGKILIGGLFLSVGGTTRNFLARLNSDGALDPAFTPNLDGAVTSLAIQADGRIVICGEFTTVAGFTRRGMARLNSDGSVDPTFQDVNISEAPSTIAIDSDGKFLIGGYFTSVAGQPRQFAARLDSNGSLDTSFSLTVGGPVAQFSFLPDGKIYICGYFTTVNGSTRTAIARIMPSGATDSSFGNVNIPSGNITAFDVQSDGKVVVGGDFSQIGGQQRDDVARVGTDGVIDVSFADPNSNFGGNFYSIRSLLVQPDANILIGGQFSMIGGQTRRNAVRLTPDGRLDLPPAQSLIVNKVADTDDGLCNADCSLREAVAAANAFAEASAIRFAANVFSSPQTITLTLGELSIADNRRVSIMGPGSTLLTISGNNNSRILRFQRDADVVVSGVTMSNGNGVGPEPGNGTGGAIYVGTGGVRTRLVVKDSVISGNRGINAGAIAAAASSTSLVSIESSTVTGNEAQVVGGISLNGSTLTITNSTISNNTATCQISGCGVGGIDVSGFSPTIVMSGSVVSGNIGSAGGLRVNGTAVISSAVISGNIGRSSAGGFSCSGTMTLIDSTVSQNTVTGANGTGGGAQNLGRLSIVNSIIQSNAATFGGGIYGSGSLTVSGSRILDNSATSGAGIYNNSSSTSVAVTITNSLVNNNNASSFGGGIYNRDLMNISTSTISNNRSGTNGGGIFNVLLSGIGAGRTNIANSTFSGNVSSAAGAAISNQDGILTLTNSTVSENTANGLGGAVYNLRGGVTIASATIAANVTGSATSGAVSNASGAISATNTIIADNVAGAQSVASDIEGPLNSGGFNLIENARNGTITGNTTGNILGQDPRLGPLAANGGPTQTRALLSGSPALDKGNNFNSGLAFDQRGSGFARSVDLVGIPDAADGTDIGSFEFQFAAGYEGDVAPRSMGDGQVVTTDLVQLRRFVTGLDIPGSDTNEFQRADVAPRSTFGDGVLNASDIVQARRYASGLDPLTNADGPLQPAPRPLTLGSEKWFGVDIRSLCILVESDNPLKIRDRSIFLSKFNRTHIRCVHSF